MTIRELIEDLQDIARRCGDRLDVVVLFDANDQDGNDWSGNSDLRDVVYQGGGTVELRT